jgi:hypothetical protein
MAASIESKRTLRAIHRLSQAFPDRTAEERLGPIGDILSGEVEAGVDTNTTSATLMARLKAGQESRSVRGAHDKREKPKKEEKAEPEDEKKRKKKGGHDRMEGDGINRSSDVNL